jgi:hypothetical protein
MKWLFFLFGSGQAKLEEIVGYSEKSARTAAARRMSYVWGSVFTPRCFSLEDRLMSSSLPLPLLFGMTGLVFVVAIYFIWVRRRSQGPVE